VKVSKTNCRRKILAAAISLVCAQTAYAASLPGAATPGGVQPSLPDYQDNLSDEPELTIPARSERPIDLEAGPVIAVQEIKLFEIFDAGASKQLVVDPAIKDLITSDRKAYPNGYTLGALQKLADRLSNHYRERGRILATVFVPAQDVENGVVELHILPGRLSEVVAVGDSGYSDEQLARPFEKLGDQVLDKESIESSLLTVLDYPGLSVSGVLEPGEGVGTTRLNLSVNSEDRFAGIVYADNKGSRYSGEERLGVGLIFNNPFGQIDQLRLDLMAQNKPEEEDGSSVDNALFGGVSYTFRPFDPSYELGFEYSYNEYDIGRELSSFGYEGRSERLGFHLKKQLRRSRTFNDHLKLKLNLNEAETTRDGDVDGLDELTTLELSYGMDFSDDLLGGGFSSLEATFTQGFDGVLGSMDNGDSRISRKIDGGVAPVDFNKLEISATRYQRFVADTTLRFRFDAQFSDDPLVSLEQFSLGGPDSVRAYPGAEFMADKGFFASAELISPFPVIGDKDAFGGKTWGEVVQLSLFLDYAKGYKNDALSSDIDKAELTGTGIGLRIAPYDGLEGNITFATQVGGDDASNKRDPQIFVDLIYQF